MPQKAGEAGHAYALSWGGELFLVWEVSLGAEKSLPRGWDGEGNGTPLQYCCLENPMDGGAWWAAVYGVAQSQTRLSDFTFTFHFHALEKEMATHSSVLAWRIPGMGEPGGLPSMGLHRVGHDWSDLAAAAGGGRLQTKWSSFSFHFCVIILRFLSHWVAEFS